jgi:glycosyltransferase involved in cell wall biosynthesis
MNIVVAGHTFVQRENWARWERFSELYADCEVTLLVQAKWKIDRYGVERIHRVEAYRKNNFQVIPLRQCKVGRQIHFSLDMHLRNLQPDIFHIVDERYGWWPYQALLYRRLCAPKVVTIGYSYTNIEYELKKFRHRLKENAFFRGMDAIICGNSEACHILRRHGYTKPISIQQENGADERIWFPGKSDEIRKKLHFKGFVTGFVGALIHDKGVLDLAEAVAEMGEGGWTFVVIGDGPLKDNMKKILAAGGKLENTRFLGYLYRENIPPLMREFDALVLPSRTVHNWKEQFGLVLAEAMLSKVATIGSDSGAIPEVIGDAGLVFPEGNVKALRDCIERLQKDHKLREDLAEKGYQRALAKYSVTALSKQSHEFFLELLEDGKSKRRGK